MHCGTLGGDRDDWQIRPTERPGWAAGPPGCGVPCPALSPSSLNPHHRWSLCHSLCSGRSSQTPADHPTFGKAGMHPLPQHHPTSGYQGSLPGPPGWRRIPGKPRVFRGGGGSPRGLLGRLGWAEPHRLHFLSRQDHGQPRAYLHCYQARWRAARPGGRDHQALRAEGVPPSGHEVPSGNAFLAPTPLCWVPGVFPFRQWFVHVAFWSWSHASWLISLPGESFDLRPSPDGGGPPVPSQAGEDRRPWEG